MNQPLAVEGDYVATVYSVEPAGDNTTDIVITLATNSSESPANLTEQLTQPLEQTLEEVTDINEQISFAIVATERYGRCICELGRFTQVAAYCSVSSEWWLNERILIAV